ncbi:MAG: hypothetical protein K2Q33_09280 [Gammaproteobacteria bacterium]|nr:hypothetical protein [Gammaproteobacteria bacterium]
MGFPLEDCYADDAAFLWQLRKETELLRCAFRDGAFANEGFDVGFEIEFHLLDEKQKPKRVSLEILKQINKPFMVSESYSSMMEFNSKHFPIAGSGLLEAHHHLISIWKRCLRICKKNKVDLVAIGSLPTFSIEDMDEKYVTALTRYQVLGEQLKKLYPDPEKTLVSRMGSSSAFHIHFRIPVTKAVDYYNAANIATAPLLAIAGNGPYFLQQRLWEESRIYLFESSSGHSAHKKGRAFFGDHYLRKTFYNLFKENLKIPPLLNRLCVKTEDPFWHLMLHNGTIWRWNRPVISLHDQGPLHVRIEHRSLPSGPTIIDMLANAFFWIGLTKVIGDDIESYMACSTFRQVRNNFYNAAQYGLEKSFMWPTIGKIQPQELILNHLLPLAYRGLESLDITPILIKDYLNIIRDRALNGQTGSRWQQKFMAHHPGAWAEMMEAYAMEQKKDKPISKWANG